MTEKEDVRSERIWRCACHYSPHFVSITADPIAPAVVNDPRVWGWFMVELTDGPPMAFRHRVKEAWKLVVTGGRRAPGCWQMRPVDRDGISARRPKPTHQLRSREKIFLASP